MFKNPFKFLDSYTKADKDIFFGREKETEEIYSRFFYSKMLLIYGPSGSGKTSLLQCGVANRFGEHDWKPVFIRRKQNVIHSINAELGKQAITPLKKKLSVNEKLYSLYLDYLTPIYLIFDQFEELFIFGSSDEKKEFVNEIKNILSSSDGNTHIIFSIREEYLANLTAFEDDIPELFENRIRIEKMKKPQALAAIEEPCKVGEVDLEEEVSEKVLERLSTKSGFIELTWLQVIMDNLYKKASERNPKQIIINKEDVAQLGKMGDVLGNFLDEQLKAMEDGEKGEAILKAMISSDGTKRQLTLEEINSSLQSLGNQFTKEIILNLLQHLINVRIISDKDENGRYELKHDSLAAKIYEKLTLAEKELLEVRQFVEFAYQSYLTRGKLLSEDDLKYLTPYEEKLILNKNQADFLAESKRIIERAKKRKRNIIYAISAVLIIVLAFTGIYSFMAQKRAEKQAIIEKSKKLGNKAMLYVEENPTIAYLIAEEAWNIYPSFEAEKAMLNSYKYSPFVNQVEDDNFWISNSKNFFLCRPILTNDINIYNYDSQIVSTCKGHTGKIGYPYFTKNDEYLISQSIEDSTIRIFDIEGTEKLCINKIGYSKYKFFNDSCFVIYTNDFYRKYDISGRIIEQETFTQPLSFFSIHDDVVFYLQDSLFYIKNIINNTIINKTKNTLLSSNLINFDNIMLNKEKDHVLFSNSFDENNGLDLIIWNLTNNTINKSTYNDERRMYGRITYFMYNYIIDLVSYSFYDQGKSILFIRNIKGEILDKINIENLFMPNIKWDFLSKDLIIVSKDKNSTYIYDINQKTFKIINGSFYKYLPKSKRIITKFNSSFEKQSEILTDNFEIKLPGNLNELLGVKFYPDVEKQGFTGNAYLYYNLKGEKIGEDVISNDYKLMGFSKNEKYKFSKIGSDIQISELDNNMESITYKNIAGNNIYMRNNYLLSQNNNKLSIIKIDTNQFKRWIGPVNIELFYLGFVPNQEEVVSIEKNHIRKWDNDGELLMEESLNFKIKYVKYVTFSDDGNNFAFGYVTENNENKYCIYSTQGLKEMFSINSDNVKIEFFNSSDTLCVICSDGIITYLNNDYDVIDEWEIQKFIDDLFSEGKSNFNINSKFISGTAQDSTFYVYNFRTKDSLRFNNEKNNLKKGNYLFQSENPKYIYELRDSKNELTILDLSLKELFLTNFSGNSLGFTKLFGDNLVIESQIKSPFYDGFGNYIGEMNEPPYYLKIINIYSNKTLNNYTIKQKSPIKDISNDLRLLLVEHFNEFAAYYSKNTIRIINLIEEKTLIEFNSNIFSNFSKDGNYLFFYDKDINKLRLFPLKPEEIIRKVREEKEFGELRYLSKQEKMEYGIID